MMRSASSNSEGFERWVTSPVWMMKAGLSGRFLILPIASSRVPMAFGLAGLSKPTWLSLICRKVRPLASAAFASAMIPMERGTPAATVHRTPVPAQVMHSRILRRLKPLSLFEVMPISFEAMLPSTSRSEIGGIYSRTFRHARRIGAARNDFATEFAPDLLELVVQALASHCRDA